MKIICTEEEKSKMLIALDESPFCLVKICKFKNCIKCVEVNIEWEITDRRE